MLQFLFQKHLKHQVETQPFAENQCIDLLGFFFVKQRQGESRERDKGNMKAQAQKPYVYFGARKPEAVKEKKKGADFAADIYDNSI